MKTIYTIRYNNVNISTYNNINILYTRNIKRVNFKWAMIFPLFRDCLPRRAARDDKFPKSKCAPIKQFEMWECVFIYFAISLKLM